MRVLIFGGTTEGRELASELAGSGHEVTVSVATDMGADELCGIAGIKTVTGRRDASGMCALLHNKDICIDATHPYATEAGRNIREACERTGVRCLRLLRDDTEGLSSAVSEYGNIICVSDAAEAAAEAAKIPGNILLTTGVKELPFFGEIERDRLFARVLPVPESLEKCREEGISARNIIAMHGPFTESLNLALIEQYGISVMVTKDGGANGGFGEKAR
ncbi:MAG: precorrin-6A reductase, partial [Lachnospiraceae bacterium]|nr:precorrin-6A reductase [Lachnospiraceae bacterium]